MSERLSAWELENIGVSGIPRTDWAEALPKLWLGGMHLQIFEKIPTNAPIFNCQAHWCYSATIQFHSKWGPFINYDFAEMTPQSWPTTHFAVHSGLWFEVCGGGVVQEDCGWWIRWIAARNTTHARHLNGKHPSRDDGLGENCDFCRAFRQRAA